MTLLKVILLVTGLLFLGFGYLIYFKKKYSLINGVEAAHRAGKKTERYAKTVGLVELILGVAFTLAAALLIIFC